MAGNLDARAKLIAALGAIVIVSSTPAGSLWAFAAYFVLIALAAVFAGVKSPVLFTRLAASLPFLLMAALLLVISEAGWLRAVAVLLKGTAAVLILTILTATTDTAQILAAMRKLGAPTAITLTSALMLRFVWMLFEEFARMSRARASRCGGPLVGEMLFRAHGSQAGLLLVRSWERADRIYQGMLARGFTGEMPVTRPGRWGTRESLFTATALALFAAARYFLRS